MKAVSTTRPKSDAGKPVQYYNGRFAGRWYCAYGGCVISISDVDHRAGRFYCRQHDGGETETEKAA